MAACAAILSRCPQLRASREEVLAAVRHPELAKRFQDLAAEPIGSTPQEQEAMLRKADAAVPAGHPGDEARLSCIRQPLGSKRSKGTHRSAREPLLSVLRRSLHPETLYSLRSPGFIG